jgi:hypothetical protein
MLHPNGFLCIDEKSGCLLQETIWGSAALAGGDLNLKSELAIHFGDSLQFLIMINLVGGCADMSPH